MNNYKFSIPYSYAFCKGLGENRCKKFFEGGCTKRVFLIYYTYIVAKCSAKGGSAVPSFTKKAIRESFLRLVAKKPLDKITVRDIVDDCGINRNTFYYYFQDIYAVLEDYYRDLFEALPTQASFSKTLCAFYGAIAEFCAARPHAARSLALSLGFEGMERYCGKSLDAVIAQSLSSTRLDTPTAVHLRMLRHAVIGLCLDVMRGEREAELPLQQLEDALSFYENAKTDKN